MKIYLVRHGETDWNKEGRVQGGVDIPLNAYGVELAEVTAEAMRDIPLDLIYTSPLQRARRTAEIMKRHRDIPVIVDERLREMSFGRYEGTLIREAARCGENPLHNFISNPGEYQAKDGENFAQVIERARDFTEDKLLPLCGRCENVLLAVHGAFIRCFIRGIEPRPLSAFWGGIPQQNCAVTIVEMTDGRMKIVEEGKLYY